MGPSGCLSDEQILRFLDGSLAETETMGIWAHVDECAACRALLANVVRCQASLTDAATSRDAAPAATTPSPPRPPPLRRGAPITDRYLVLEPIGVGGMGIVYAAYDQTLERKVALKVVRPTTSSDEAVAEVGGATLQARLVREAQVLARLSHPHIVPVYDAGSFGGQVYMAMEFVDGVDLRRWLREERRSQAAILGAFEQVARGLHAAHEAGLVHRDFKPENALVGRDGRVRVADFGLARPIADLAGSDVDVGAVAGTPRYLAAELTRGGPATERSDQFAFCVSLYEALYGEHPFGDGRDAGTLTAIRRGVVRRPPAGRSVPAWLRAVLLRGLHADPAARFTSLAELADRLAASPRRRLARRLLVAGAAVALGAVTVAAVQQVQQRRSLCRGSERRLDGLWDGATRLRVKQAFLRTGAPYADATWRRVEASLDDFARRWVAARADACEATHVRGEQSEELLDRRMLCLDHQLGGVGALVHVFETADATVVEKAAQAAADSGSPDECSARRVGQSGVLPPRDGRARARVEALRGDLARATALSLAGKYEDGLAVARRVAEEARPLDYRPLDAEAAHVLGSLQSELGDWSAAEATLARSLGLALATGHHALVAAVAPDLLVVAMKLTRPQSHAALLASLAQGAVEHGGTDADRGRLLRVISDLARVEARFADAERSARDALSLLEESLGADSTDVMLAFNTLSSLLVLTGRPAEAAEVLRRALAIAERALGAEHPRVGRLLYDLGVALRAQGRSRDALAVQQRGLALRERALGSTHPYVAHSLAEIAANLADMERLAEARRYLQRAIEITERSLGAAHLANAYLHAELGEVAAAQGRTSEALSSLRRALAMFEKAQGAEHPIVGEALVSLGWASLRRGARNEALQHAQRALAIHRRAWGGRHIDVARDLALEGQTLAELGRDREALERLEGAVAIADEVRAGEHPDMAKFLCAKARVLRALGRSAEATEHYRRAMTIREKALGPGGPWLAEPLAGIGEIEIERGDARAGMAHLEEAVRLVERAEVPRRRAEARLALARALSRIPRERARALALTEQAVGDLDEGAAAERTRVGDARVLAAAPPTRAHHVSR